MRSDVRLEMDSKKKPPERKRNRLENYDYSSCGAYFVTICTKERRNYFWNNGRPYNVKGGAAIERIRHKTYWSFYLAKTIF